jgi:hypothetical protein
MGRFEDRSKDASILLKWIESVVMLIEIRILHEI